MKPVPERAAAKAAGERHYSTGKPCKNGHLALRFTANGVCVECAKITHARYLAAHPGLEARWARDRRAKDPTGHRAEAQRWYEKNKDRAAAAAKAWREANPERRREISQRWRDENREHVREYLRERMRVRRGLRKHPNGGNYSPEDIAAIRERQNDDCAACGKGGVALQIDHIVAITRGGTNDPHNIQLLCGPCNKSKGNRDFAEWSIAKGFYTT